MVSIVVVQLLVFLLGMSVGLAKVDRLHSQGYLGERKLDSYADRYYPLVSFDVYQGKLAFEDDMFFQNYFRPYIFSDQELSFFLRSELRGGMTCSNELFSEHFDDLQYSYRLITLSYLIEAQWHMKLMTDHLRLKEGCEFDLQKWARACNPRNERMKKFVERLLLYAKYDEKLPHTYKKDDWWKEFSSVPVHYSQYRMASACKSKCLKEDMGAKFKLICQENEKLMGLVCSEIDEMYGLSSYRNAYFLLGQSNIINTFNKRGEAMGCLRRFSEVMAHKEVQYPALNQLFPVLNSFLQEKYKERWVQGRTFFFGASKEFEDKGLKEVFVSDQAYKVETIKDEPDPVVVTKAEVPKVVEGQPKVVEPKSEKKEVVEIKHPVKSAFLQAAEIRSSGNLPQVEVDMLKLKYDYVFTLNMMNTLSERLKTFMTREALLEMMTYDKLGTKEGPVPLLFIKFMIDMQEHQGLWNLISVLGDKFFVSNEIDSAYSPDPEYVHIVNNEVSGRQWLLYVLRP